MAEDDTLLVNVVDHLPLGVWIARAPSGEFVFANKVFHEIMGMSAISEVAVGEYAQPYGIYDEQGELYPESKMPFVRALQAGETISVDDIVIHRRDGRRVNVRATARPIRNSANDITHIVIAFADITAERAAERATQVLEKRKLDAERLEALGTLASGVAHDFNNILASIQVMASRIRLAGEKEPTQTRDDLRRIERAVETAAQLTRSLLTFGRGSAEPSSRVEVTEVVRGVVDMISRTFDRKIDVAYESSGFAFIRGDSSQIEQIVLNLAVNARDAMPSGGTLSISVRPHLGIDPHVRIEVADTGSGVPDTLKPHIFEPYFTTKDEPQQRGSGLGLATVYGVVKARGGAIEVLDALPHGARFVVKLPLESGSREPRELAEDTTKDEVEMISGSGLVLLADDEPLVRQAIRHALTLVGYQVIEAKDGVDAISVYRARHTELQTVLIDAVMPKLGGVEASRLLHEISCSVPIVLMSGRIPHEDASALEKCGIRAFLTKPFGVPELSRTLAMAIRGKKSPT